MKYLVFALNMLNGVINKIKKLLIKNKTNIMETFHLLEKYLLENLSKEYDEPRLSDYEINGSIIKFKIWLYFYILKR